jgi:hypothetical protein
MSPICQIFGLQFNGAKETRTPDPLHAMQVLYQLSYGPMNGGDALGLVPSSCRSLHRRRPDSAAHALSLQT